MERLKLNIDREYKVSEMSNAKSPDYLQAVRFVELARSQVTPRSVLIDVSLKI